MNHSKKNIVLGISTSHDSGASLIVNNQLVYAVNEERLSRKKMHIGFPFKSINLLLKEFDLHPEDISSVGVAGKINLGEMPLRNDMLMDNGEKKFLQKIFETVDSIPYLSNLFNSKLILKIYRFFAPFISKKLSSTIHNLNHYGFKCPIFFFDHHLSHAASAYYFYGESDALIFSNDGFGDGLCSGVYRFKGHNPEIINVNSFKNSIGVYYGFATKLCGFNYIHHAGKTTGLAAFGNNKLTVEIFKKYINWDKKLGNYVNKKKNFSKILKQLDIELNNCSKEDIAAGIQTVTEDLLAEYINHYLEMYPSKHILLSGGVHANVKANQKIFESIQDKINSFFVYPAMSDVGLSAGSAWLAAAKNMSPDFMPQRSSNVFLGPKFNNEIIEKSLKEYSELSFLKSTNIEKDIALHISQNKVVARFLGRMEYGPRALCNRSILYNAKDKSVNKWLNKQLNRTEFMPFAPVLMDIDASSFLKNFDHKSFFTSQFMTITYETKDIFLREAPAAVHVDNTVRPQIVTKDQNPSIYKVLEEYKKLTGLSVLVNTSFNMHEEPIVCSPEDAIRAFLLSNIDVLAIEDYLCIRST